MPLVVVRVKSRPPAQTLRIQKRGLAKGPCNDKHLRSGEMLKPDPPWLAAPDSSEIMRS